MNRHESMSDFKVEASHPVKIQEFGRVVGISQEFMGLSTTYVQTGDLSRHAVTVYRNPVQGYQKSRDFEG